MSQAVITKMLNNAEKAEYRLAELKTKVGTQKYSFSTLLS